VYGVKGFTQVGDIELANGWVVSKDFGHLAVDRGQKVYHFRGLRKVQKELPGEVNEADVETW
jgi:hypothetical protein